ncbi:MAG: hypothetical protein ACT4O5_08720 [Gammaproteobacteria bacterium]
MLSKEKAGERRMTNECDAGDELKAIAELISAGIDSGLLAELVWSFGQARAAGDSVAVACGFAYREWDL